MNLNQHFLMILQKALPNRIKTSFLTHFSKIHLVRCFFHEKKKNEICQTQMLLTWLRKEKNKKKKMKQYLFYKTFDKSLRRRLFKNFLIKLELEG